jgi:hypothetical protein
LKNSLRTALIGATAALVFTLRATLRRNLQPLAHPQRRRAAAAAAMRARRFPRRVWLTVP